MVVREPVAQLCVTSDQGEVHGSLKVVELVLNPPHPRADVGRDLVPEVANAEHATHEYAQQSPYEEDQHHDSHHLLSRSTLAVCTREYALGK
jgi:hypothetical protein